MESGGVHRPAGTGRDQELCWPRSAEVMPWPQGPGEPASQPCSRPSLPSPHMETCPQGDSQPQPQGENSLPWVTGESSPRSRPTAALSKPGHCACSVTRGPAWFSLLLCPLSCHLGIRMGKPREMKFTATAAVLVTGRAGRKWKPLRQSFLAAGAPRPRPRSPRCGPVGLRSGPRRKDRTSQGLSVTCPPSSDIDTHLRNPPGERIGACGSRSNAH